MKVRFTSTRLLFWTGATRPLERLTRSLDRVDPTWHRHIRRGVGDRLAGLLILLGLMQLTAACEGESTDPGGEVPNATVRQFLEEIVDKLVEDAQWVSNFSHQASDGGFPELGFSHTLIGVDDGARGWLVLAPEARLGPLDPSCDSDLPEPEPPAFWKERDRCLRLRRLSEQTWAADVYFTLKPRREAEDRHPFSYETGDGRGTLAFEQNPLISWIVDLRDAGAASVTATVERDVLFDAVAASPVDLSHTATVAAHHEDPSRTEDTFQLTFAHATTEGELVVTLQVGNVEPFTAAGQVMLGEQVVAEIGGSAPDLSFVWR